jgi:phosphohistidine phosphatase
MKLFFLRHGIAEDAHGGMSDAERALTEEGREQLGRIARALLRFGVKPDIVLTSPLVRATQTAEIVAPVLESPIEIVPELQPGCGLEDLQGLLRRYDQDAIMLVGHEPDFSSLAARLINADERGIVLKKAGLIRVEVDGQPKAGRGRLSGLLTPKMLLLMTDATTADT